MKRFTLFMLSALFVATASLAQPAQKRVLKPLLQGTELSAKKAPSAAMLQRQRDVNVRMSARETFSLLKKAEGLPKAPWQGVAPRRLESELITDQPEGDYRMYSRSGVAYYYYYGIFSASVFGMVGEFVFADDGTVYMKNVVTQFPCNSWIVGKLSGSEITFEFPQVAMDYYGTLYYYMMQKYDATEDTYVYDESLTTLKLSYDESTGSIFSDESSDIAKGNTIVGLCSSDGGWTGYGDYGFMFTPHTDEPVTAPDGLETADYAVTAEGFSGTLAQVGFTGNEVYVQGLYPNMPDAWVKGTISGNKVTFASGQYMGPDFVNGYHQYLMAANAEELYDDYYEEYYTEYSLTDGDIVFDYDAETKTLTNGTCMLVNAGKESVNYAAAYNNTKMKPFVEVAATPAAPTWLYFMEPNASFSEYKYGWGSLQVGLPTSDINGDYIVPEKVSYMFYLRVNGEEIPYELSSYCYQYLPVASMTEIPNDYDDGWDIGVQGTTRTVYYYAAGFEAMGVQAIYRGGGEERRSEIAWQEVNGPGSEVQPDAATPEYPELDPANTGSSVGYSYYTGVEEITLFGEYRPETYDVAIKIQDPALVGTHIDEVLVPLQAISGANDLKVWLSTQLRVENGVNVPDLTSVSFEAAEEGFIKVTLPKPYTIPEEGVYVGYSMTFNAVSTADDEQPVVVFNGGHKGGLYLHTSKEIMKWMDLSERFGVSSLLQVTVSGSSIKDNAASPNSDVTQYVKVGEPTPASVVVSNHGAQGIQSLDIDYTLNGTTTSRHYDLAEPVDGSFGLSCTISDELPAIPERGNYDLQVKVTKVNGADNADAVAEATIPYVALNSVPKHRTLMEEYTGTWCGWCVRGFYALEQLAELYPDDFVCVSYHNGDPMEIMPYTDYPNDVTGYPFSWVDRVAGVDPYYGDGNAELGIATTLADRGKKFGHASIELETSYSADDDAVNVTANVSFPYDIDDAAYTIEYILVEDGLTGEAGTDWDQANYYSGGDNGEMGGFEAMDSHVSGLVFNDVVVMTSQLGVHPYRNYDYEALPASIQADNVYTHTYTFNLAEALNTGGDYLIQDKSKLRVVAVLVNTATGEVANANKVKVGEKTGINTLTADMNNIRSIEYFDLSGRKVSRAQQGVSIMRINYNNGTSKSVKVLRK